MSTSYALRDIGNRSKDEMKLFSKLINFFARYLDFLRKVDIVQLNVPSLNPFPLYTRTLSQALLRQAVAQFYVGEL